MEPSISSFSRCLTRLQSASLALLTFCCLFHANADVAAQHPAASSEQESTSHRAEDPRVEWRFKAPNGVLRIVHVKDDDWVQHMPDGQTKEMVETNRTKEYIELTIPNNKTVLRLKSASFLSQRNGAGKFMTRPGGGWHARDEKHQRELMEMNKPEINKQFVLSPGTPQTKGKYRFQIVYFVPSDRKPVSDYEDRIANVVNLLSEVITNDLKLKGYDTNGPQFVEENGKPKVRFVRGKRTALEYSQGKFKSPQHAQRIFVEVEKKIGTTKKKKTLIFAETYELDEAKLWWNGHIALAQAFPPKAGRCVFSAWILRDEFTAPNMDEYRQLFFDNSPVDGRVAMSSFNRSAVAEFMEDGVGGCMHELAHIYGIGHQEGIRYIMKNGFRNMRYNVGVRDDYSLGTTFSNEHAAVLMASPTLNGSIDDSDSKRPQVSIKVAKKGGNLVARVSASDNKGLKLICIYEKNPAATLVGFKMLDGKKTVDVALDLADEASLQSQFEAVVLDSSGNHGKALSR